MFQNREIDGALDVYYPLRNHKSPMSFLSLFSHGYLLWYTCNYHGSRKGPKEIGEAVWLTQTFCEASQYGFKLRLMAVDGGLADEWYAATGRNKKGEEYGKALEEVVDALLARAPSDEETSPSYVKLMSVSSRISKATLRDLTT